MKKHLSTIILILIFFTGVALLLYPIVSDYLNTLHQSKVINVYAGDVANLNQDEYETIWKDAQNYNANLAKTGNTWVLSGEQRQIYSAQLNVAGRDMMGYIEIPKLQSSLPIYHGISEGVLQIAIGHLEGSSLPVGGESSHCVLSGHRGLPSAKLFSELDRLVEGDVFVLRTLNEILTYEVDRILIVVPEDTAPLMIEEGADYCTLVTCTPYGVNSHRMLVRGHRIENKDDLYGTKITADASQIDEVVVMSVLSFLILAILAIIALIKRRQAA